MSPLQISVIIFVLMTGSTFVGMLLNPFIQNHHLSLDYKDLLRGTRSISVQLTAVTLGLLIAQSLGSFEKKSDELKAQASNIITLDRILSDFGQESKKARTELQKAIADEIDRIHRANKNGANTIQQIGNINIEVLRNALLSMPAKNESQTYLKTTSLALGEQIIASRWRIYEQFDSEVQWPLVVILVLWLLIIFFSLGAITPRDWILVVGLLLSSFSLTAAMYLLIELDTPFQGLITISS